MRPRDLVMSHLRAVDEITDPAGRASAALAEAVGYTGTSLAFAQLLHEMDRSGLIERDIRGKRTYRIALASPAAGSPGSPGSPGPAPGPGVDYDKLARRLLAEVVRRVAVSGDAVSPGSPRESADLARTVASLERKLASVEARQHSLRAENARLRGAVRLLERLLASLRDDDSPGQSA